MKRTFLAIPIPSGDEFPALSQRLQRNLQHEHISWCKTNQIHLTLNFVGDTPDEDIPKIIQACQEVAKRHQPFDMDFNRTGIFGSNHEMASMRLDHVFCLEFTALYPAGFFCNSNQRKRFTSAQSPLSPSAASQKSQPVSPPSGFSPGCGVFLP